MKKFTHRLLPLALCFTLTLGVFAYRPSEAKAIAGVDDAVVIGALLSAFAGGCGLIFSNNGMTSGELAQGLTDKWNEFKAAVLEADTTFAGWLGYEDMDALLQAIVLSGGNALTVPRAIARKLAEFTEWFVDTFELSTSRVIMSGHIFADRLYLKLSDSDRAIYPYYIGFYSPTSSFDGIQPYTLVVSCEPIVCSYVERAGTVNGVYISSSNFRAGYYLFNKTSNYIHCFSSDGKYKTGRLLNLANSVGYYFLGSACSDLQYSGALTVPSFSAGTSVNVEGFSHLSGKFGDAADDDTAPPPTITGVGDGTATTIEGLLQQILAQLQANTLAPTLEVAGTETGGNTGTDEDAKPYLPYIPQIFEKIKELPGTLANIWETVKGIPAAIAEKIGAFFTTLWGWLQNIIDAITALPAAIAEKVGALFKPDEALLSEITDTFKGKFGFFSTLKQFGSDLFGMTPETEPPVIWVHLENAESKFGYNYGDKQKIFDMTWYQKYKASVDGLLSGFLWLGYLWLLFRRAPSILNGMQMDEDLRPPLLVGDVSSAPRLGAGDPSIHYGEGFTFRSKGGKRK
nr:MAG TPA: hypothetical protein [Inoviridae sp.]